MSGHIKPDFAALRAQRDTAIEGVIQSICDKQGWKRSEVLAHVSGGHGCYCACADGGPCEHEFTEWRDFEDGSGGEAVCKLCGGGAMSHSLRMDFE